MGKTEEYRTEGEVLEKKSLGERMELITRDMTWEIKMEVKKRKKLGKRRKRGKEFGLGMDRLGERWWKWDEEEEVLKNGQR